MTKALKMALIAFTFTGSSAFAVCEGSYQYTALKALDVFCVYEARAELYCYSPEGAPELGLLEIYHVLRETNTQSIIWVGHPMGESHSCEDYYSDFGWARACYINDGDYWIGDPDTGGDGVDGLRSGLALV